MSKPLKDIKRLVRKQIKKVYPNFNRLTKKLKKKVLKDICTEVYATYDMTTEVTAPSHELLNICELPEEIITIDQMQNRIKQKKRSWLFQHLPYRRLNDIKDRELRDIIEMIDWDLLNEQLLHRNYTAGKREIIPVQFFRAELLKHLKYPELSYRKYADREINNKERKENRTFIGLKRNQEISHSQLSQFRSSVNFSQLANVMVYFICLFFEKRPLSSSTFYAVDSSELAVKVSPYPLFKLKIGDQYIRFYQDIDADVGSRRQKRDKSRFVVGYRLHTLTIIDAEREKAFPLLSILAPANHHDSNFLSFLIEFGKRIGLPLNIVATDQAYGEAEETTNIQMKHNVTVLNTPKKLTKLPVNVDEQTYEVYKNSFCPVVMEYRGKDKSFKHEFHCQAQPGECPLQGSCDKIRFIPVDSGAFGQIPSFFGEAQRINQMRKVAERPFNLIKHRDGLEPLRTKGIENSTFVAGLANITTLLIEIAGYRKKKKNNDVQFSLPFGHKAA